MKKTTYLNIVLYIMFSLFVFSTTLYAWMTLTNSNKTDFLNAQVADYGAIMSFDVRKNDGEYVSIATIEEMHVFFGQTLPSDQIDFRIYVHNLSTKTVNALVEIRNMQSNADEGFDMRDVFYLNDGAIFINGTPQYLTPNSLNPVIKYGQNLNLYRFTNLINASNNLIILNNQSIEVEDELTIEFSITYDAATNDLGYHLGVFVFNAIYVSFT